MTEAGKRPVWLQEFNLIDATPVGARWPEYIVERWERNEIGERRFTGESAYLRAALRDTTTPAQDENQRSRVINLHATPAPQAPEVGQRFRYTPTGEVFEWSGYEWMHPAPQAEGLDVERLARAMAAVYPSFRGATVQSWDDESDPSRRLMIDHAGRIARAYADAGREG